MRVSLSDYTRNGLDEFCDPNNGRTRPNTVYTPLVELKKKEGLQGLSRFYSW